MKMTLFQRSTAQDNHLFFKMIFWKHNTHTETSSTQKTEVIEKERRPIEKLEVLECP